jgi:hypothetical protein
MIRTIGESGQLLISDEKFDARVIVLARNVDQVRRFAEALFD